MFIDFKITFVNSKMHMTNKTINNSSLKGLIINPIRNKLKRLKLTAAELDFKSLNYDSLAQTLHSDC